MTVFQISHSFDIQEKSFLHLICEGDLTIRNIEEIKKMLAFPMQKVTRLEFVLRDVHFLDFAFLQLTISLISEFLEHKNKSFQFDFQLNEEFSKLLDTSGILSVYKKYRNIKSA